MALYKENGHKGHKLPGLQPRSYAEAPLVETPTKIGGLATRNLSEGAELGFICFMGFGGAVGMFAGYEFAPEIIHNPFAPLVGVTLGTVGGIVAAGIIGFGIASLFDN